MKRDMHLIRQILLAMEEHEHGYVQQELKINGFSEDQIGYHVWLMGGDQAGLIEVEEIGGMDSPFAFPVAIQWQGYEFLEAAREPSTWNAAMEKMQKVGAGLTIDALKGLLLALSKEALGIK